MAGRTRTVSRRFKGAPTMEGAGVRLQRMFGNSEVPLLDPFLLLDNFGSMDPADYIKGFPWHPHRGMETVTYMLDGRTKHEDTLGNKGIIRPGEVQWMSAGSGIMHQEMPQRTEGLLSGFQLWINLPRNLKMETPAYRGVTASAIPVVKEDDGTLVKVIAGKHGDATGPVQHIAVDPLYIDVTLPPNAEFKRPVVPGHTVFAQVIEGRGCFDPLGAPSVGASESPLYASPGGPGEECFSGPGETSLYGDGDLVHVKSGAEGVRFILASGKPLHEPVAWYGPIVMNTRDEILTAMRDLERGSFIRHKKVLNEL